MFVETVVQRSSIKRVPAPLFFLLEHFLRYRLLVQYTKMKSIVADSMRSASRNQETTV
jgi:hypothetical protein